MKTRPLHINNKLWLVVSLMMVSGVVFSQTTRHRESGSNRNSTGTSGRYESTGRDNRSDRVIVRDREDENRNDNREVYRENRTDNENWKKDDHHKSGHHNHWEKKDKGKWDKHDNRDHHYSWKHYYYHRPVTYNVWHFPAPWKHAKHSIVFRHDHGDYYFHHGRFYRYHPHHGYFVVEYPAGIVFRYLPVGYEEMMINRTLYYRYGDVWFEYTPVGYVVCRPPVGFYISAHF